MAKSRVLRMIIGESIVLSLLGACCGVLLCVPAARWLSEARLVQGLVCPVLSVRLLFVSLILGVGAGVLGALYPAWHGMRIEPSEALRYE